MSPNDDDLLMTVGAREIYDKLVETSNSVKRLDEKFDDRITAIGATLADHEGRLRGLEQWKWITRGAAVAGSSALGWLIALKTGAA